MSELDTVGGKFYKPLERVNIVGNWLFWIVAMISFVVLHVDSTACPTRSEYLQVAFLIFAMAYFLQGQIQRLYFFPRAEDARRQELLSNSFGIALTHEETVGYYNNSYSDPIKRLAASSMESAFFTHAIVRKMLMIRRTVTIGYIVAYLVALSSRSTEIGVLTVAAQVLFSEQMISQWLRMEWLRARSEQVFDKYNRLFAWSDTSWKPVGQAQAIEYFAYYETTKSTAAVLLSSRIFHRYNSSLTEDWERIRARVGA